MVGLGGMVGSSVFVSAGVAVAMAVGAMVTSDAVGSGSGVTCSGTTVGTTGAIPRQPLITTAPRKTSAHGWQRQRLGRCIAVVIIYSGHRLALTCRLQRSSRHHG